MRPWKEARKEVRRVRPDRGMARGILKMIEVRMKALKLKDREEFASLVVEDYYEVIKEAITALMAIDGYKTLSHEVLIAYLKEFYAGFSDSEIMLMDQLRVIRNRIAYKGFFISADYLERNEARIEAVVAKIKKALEEKLNQ
jgi:hypothetical protein